MREILLTSSVLIAALLALRKVFQKTISRRAQYALWGLVVLRLLVPVNLPALHYNVLTAAEPVQTQVAARLERQTVALPVERAPLDQHPEARDAVPETPANTVQQPAGPQVSAATDSWVAATDTTAVRYHRMTTAEVLTAVWCAGMAVMAAWFLFTNLRFARKLRRNRIPYPVEGCKYPVYLVQGLPSPCLFGLFRPAVYLTPASVESPETLRHVLTHETTHARHGDPIWSLLRCVCLAVYWFDPLVWAAAIVSRRDCELACDEGALKRLGEDERIPYGRTLLRLIPVARKPESPMLSATTMTAGKKELKDRITRIAENRRTVGIALLAVVAAAGVVCAATFTGAVKTAGPDPLPPEEVARYNRRFNFTYPWTDYQGNACHFKLVQFLTSTYDRPEDVDMYQLFYNGAAVEQETTPAERQAVVDTGYSGYDPEVDLVKVSAGQVDDVLTKWLGLSLAETDARSMGSFTYLADYDAYYHFHGDTNAPGYVQFYAGEQEGDAIALYYRAEDFRLVDTAGSGEEVWAKVTVEPQSDGGFHILSNKLCDRPDRLAPQPLTEEELAYFNNDFFNGEMTADDGQTYSNLHNQFLTCLYADPREINMFNLLYNGVGPEVPLTQEELEALNNIDAEGNKIYDVDKFTLPEVNAFLFDNIGLTMDGTEKIDWDQFKYIEQFDARYHVHSDTNYRSVTFSYGERVGDYIQLYWKDFYYGELTTECVTLLDRGDGQYWFVSHLLTDKDIPSPYNRPEGDPWMTLSLDGLTPYEPQKMYLTRHTGDWERLVESRKLDWNGGRLTVCSYLSTDGSAYAALTHTDSFSGAGDRWEGDAFFTFPDMDTEGLDAMDIGSFQDLFGRSGFKLEYTVRTDQSSGTVTDYYYLDDDGTPWRLASVRGDTTQMDLDDDGEEELCADSIDSAQIIFRRDGQLYDADIKSLLESAWPELRFWDWADWDYEYRRLAVHGFVTMPEWSSGSNGETPKASFVRDIYFDGENLLVYKPEADEVTDHMVGTPSSYIPHEAVAAARANVLEAYQTWKNRDANAEFDDWRVNAPTEVWEHTYRNGALYVYSAGYSFHAGNPAGVTLAGGAYVDEDGWFVPDGNDGSGMLAFMEKDGELTFLNDRHVSVDLDLEPFNAEMQRWAVKLGLASAADATPEELLNQLYIGSGGQFLTQLSEMSEEERRDVCRQLDEILQSGTAEQQSTYLDAVQTMAWCSYSFNDAQREAYDYFLDNSARSSQSAARAQAIMDALTSGGTVTLDLTPADGVGGGAYTTAVSDGTGAIRAQGFSGSFYWATASNFQASGSSITIKSPSGDDSITAWEGSNIIRCTDGGEWVYLMAAATSSAPYDGNTVFTYLRKWYDEVEYNALVSAVTVPEGASRADTAQAWLDAVGEVTMRQVTPGSKYENSFVQNRAAVGTGEPAGGMYAPELLAGEHFTFTNERIFVPGNYRSKENQTVNGTARAYNGEYGPMPGGGAFLDSASGLLYRTAEGWRGTFAP